MEALTEVESKVIEVEDIAVEEKESCLLGRLVTQQNWDPSVVIRAMKKAWKRESGLSSSVFGESKVILFRFDSPIERDWVIKNQPWLYKRCLFAIKKFTGDHEELLLPSSPDVRIDHASFWARLYDVPMSCMNERSIRLFATRIGTLETVDTSGEDLFGSFVRFKISMNITKPLMRGITIRVKGKHLWLPLRYESLPYCLSCGVINHDVNNCHSFCPKNLRYGRRELRVPFSSKRKDNTPATLPQDIIQNILSRVPAKYLIRFKVVSKLWDATISNPNFAEMHLHQFRKSHSRNPIAREEWQDFIGVNVVEIKYGKFHFLSVIKHSGDSKFGYGINLCYCDGLYLNCRRFLGEIKSLLLWNPSCRAYQEIQCPKPINGSSHRVLYGLYYDPLMKGYKIVLADTEHYSVFSCRCNRWGEAKKITGIPSIGYYDTGVSCNGSYYWPVTHRVGKITNFDIICFDGKDEKFRKVTRPKFKGEAHMFTLTSTGRCLYLFHNSNANEMMILKKVEGMDSWMEIKVQLDLNFGRCPAPRCWLNEDEILLDVQSMTQFVLYNQRDNNISTIYAHRYHRDFPVPYLENLFLQNKRRS